MYHQVEVLASENNKKNQDFAIHLERLQEKHKREMARSKSHNRVEHIIVQQQSPQQQIHQSPIQYVT